MGASIKVDRINAGKAFEQEANRLATGELSRFLPGFTAIRVVHENSGFSGGSRITYLATRVRDGKLYGFQIVEAADSLFDGNPFTQLHCPPTITLNELVEKTRVVTSYESA